jgi:tetratricopeptide (TPR) repeat protein
VNVINGDVATGIRILEQALPFLDEDYAIAEAMLDLCLGYCELENYESAEAFGQRALTLATVDRQVRNANYLLGRIAMANGNYDEASDYFDVVAGFYPEYKNVKELLQAVDLGAVVNWKA